MPCRSASHSSPPDAVVFRVHSSAGLHATWPARRHFSRLCSSTQPLTPTVDCWLCIAVVALARLARRSGPARSVRMSGLGRETLLKTSETIKDYDAVAASFDDGNKTHDVSQNLEALLKPLLAGGDRALDVLDLGCAGGRDLVALTQRGHRAVGLEGSPAFVALARAKVPGCEVWQQDLAQLDLPRERFDGVFANATLFHVPIEALDGTLSQVWATLRPGGVFFCSNAHGFGEDKDGWTQGRTPGTRSWVCWLSEETWVARCERAGFELLDLYYRPPGRPRAQQAFLATVWRKGERGGASCS